MLVWNEYDFIESLGVLALLGEYEISHSYKVEKGGPRLELSVGQYYGGIRIELFRKGADMGLSGSQIRKRPGHRLPGNRGDKKFRQAEFRLTRLRCAAHHRFSRLYAATYGSAIH
jgi:hypothetical protein